MKRFLYLVCILILCTPLILMPLVCADDCTCQPEPHGVSITITSSPVTGLTCFQVGSITNTRFGSPEFGPLTNYTTPKTFYWMPGDIYNITVLSPASALLDMGVREECVWTSWSDGGSQSRIYTVPREDAVLTINFNFSIQYYLTVATYGTVENASYPGGVNGTWALSPQSTPQSGWYNAGSQVTLTAPGTATDADGRQYTFGTWWVDGRPATGNPVNVIVSGPESAIAFYNDPPRLGTRWATPL